MTKRIKQLSLASFFLLLGGQPAWAERGVNDWPWTTIAYWSFDEAQDGRETRMADHGPHGHAATLHVESDDYVALSEGIHGNALTLTADAPDVWVDVPFNDAMQLSVPFTIAAWIRPEQHDRTVEIFCQSVDTLGSGLRLRYGWQRLYVQIGQDGKPLIFHSPPNSVMPGRWHHVALTYNGKTCGIFSDGQEIFRQDVSNATLTQHARGTVLGNYLLNRKDVYQFIGQIDELVVLGEALDAAGVVDLGIATKAGVRPADL